MIPNEVKIYDIKRNEKREICFIGDFHFKSGKESMSILRKAIEYVATRPTARWVGMGDNLECITRTDPRFDPNSHSATDTMMDHTRELAKLVEPIAPQCLGIHAGNHEEKFLRYYPNTADPLKELCLVLDVSNLGYGGCFHRITYYDGKHGDNIIIHTAHGHQASKYTGATVNHLESLFAYFHGVEVVARGHNHKLVADPCPAIEVTERGKVKLIDRPRWAFATGSFYRGFVEGQASYAEKWDRKPVPLGFAVLEIQFDPLRLNGRVETYTTSIKEE